MKIGVYAIVHTASGKRYIGSSANISKRFGAHRRALRKGKHQNVHFQRAWDKYSEAAFDFQVVEECLRNACRPTEQRHLDGVDFDTLYNIARDAHRGTGKWGRLGKTNTPEHNRKIGDANRGKPNPRKGKTHDWGHKAGATWTKNWPYRVRAEHLDGRVLMFDSQGQAGTATGASRDSVKNIVNGRANRTLGGWTYCKVQKEV